jgi:hypothetical protein
MTDLDFKIAAALEALRKSHSTRAFDYEAYARAFQQSAQAKARETLAAIAANDADNPFAKLRPVFVSIGGADAEELVSLLANSSATRGILIEQNRDLAQVARDRAAALKPKVLEVFEGDAQERVAEAIKHAASLVEDRQGDYIAVTCHAVIHELFDRGRQEFDPFAFFATIFGSDKSTWFTYREPGAPEKWPSKVLLKANCTPKSLLDLAAVVASRHSSLRSIKEYMEKQRPGAMSTFTRYSERSMKMLVQPRCQSNSMRWLHIATSEMNFRNTQTKATTRRCSILLVS